MDRIKITPTAEVGIVIAIAVTLGLISAYLPVLGVFLEFFWSMPFVFLAIRQDVKKAALALSAAIILLSLLTGPMLSVRLALSFGLSGLALGFAIKENFSAVKMFMLTLLVAFASQILSMLLLTFVMNVNILENQIEMVKGTLTMYESMGLEPSQIEEARLQVESIVTLLSFLMPTLILLMALADTTACFFTAKWLAPKLGIQFPEFPPFSQWRFPVAFLYLMILALLGIYWGSTRNLTMLYTVSINANVLALFVGFVQGLSILSFAADRFNISKLVRRLIFVVLILNFMLFQIVAFTGLFDMFFDYRRRIK